MKRTRRETLMLLAVALFGVEAVSCGNDDNTSSAGNPTPARSVIVVGAGLAGIAAARTLTAAGYEVVILEARDRVGGRTVSVPLGNGFLVDLGASWIHGVQGNPIAQLCTDLGVGLIKTSYEDHEIFANGVVLPDADDLALRALAEAMFKAIAAAQDLNGEDTNVGAFFENWVLGLDPKDQDRARYLLVTEIEHEYAADATQLSLYSFDAARAPRGDEVMLDGGYGQLPQLLVKQLDVRLEVVVDHIERHATGVTVRSGAKVFEADYVVCAVPLGVLKGGGITFEPPLPEAHRAAMARLEVGVLDKLFLRFATPFWEAKTKAQALGRMGSPTGRFAEWINLHALKGQPVLLGFNAGNEARALPAADQELVAFALEDLRSMFGDIVTEPVEFRRTRWEADPYALGSYSAFGVGSSPADLESLAVPVDGRLFFAGEHTHPTDPSTTHGAWKSGIRAAEDVKQSA